MAREDLVGIGNFSLTDSYEEYMFFIYFNNKTHKIEVHYKDESCIKTKIKTLTVTKTNIKVIDDSNIEIINANGEYRLKSQKSLCTKAALILTKGILIESDPLLKYKEHTKEETIKAKKEVIKRLLELRSAGVYVSLVRKPTNIQKEKDNETKKEIIEYLIGEVRLKSKTDETVDYLFKVYSDSEYNVKLYLAKKEVEKIYASSDEISIIFSKSEKEEIPDAENNEYSFECKRGVLSVLQASGKIIAPETGELDSAEYNPAIIEKANKYMAKKILQLKQENSKEKY